MTRRCDERSEGDLGTTGERREPQGEGKKKLKGFVGKRGGEVPLEG